MSSLSKLLLHQLINNLIATGLLSFYLSSKTKLSVCCRICGADDSLLLYVPKQS